MTRLQKAYENIKYAAYDIIGGLENTMMDYIEEDEEYQEAEKLLSDHKTLVQQVYEAATTCIYGPGYCSWNKKKVEQEIRPINLLGKEKLMHMCDERVTEEGY